MAYSPLTTDPTIVDCASCAAGGPAKLVPAVEEENKNKMDSEVGDEVIVWEWFSDHGRWRAYEPSVVAHLEAANGRQHILSLGEIEPTLSSYEIDLLAMQQIRSNTGSARPVRRRVLPATSPAAKGVEWQWQDSSGWIQYDLDTSAIIEDAHMKDLPSIDLSKTRCHLPYIVDFSRMTQERRTTGFSRALRRVTLDAAYPKARSDGLSVSREASSSSERLAGDEAQVGEESGRTHDALEETCQIELSGDVERPLSLDSELSRPASLSIPESINETSAARPTPTSSAPTTPNVPQVVDPTSTGSGLGMGTGTGNQGTAVGGPRAGKRSHGKRSSSRKSVAAARDVQATMAWTSPGDPDVASTSSASSGGSSTGRTAMPRSVSVPVSMASGQTTEGNKHIPTTSPDPGPGASIGLPPLTQSATMSHLASAAAANTSRMRKSHSTPCTIQTRTANAAGARLSPIMTAMTSILLSTALPVKLVPVRMPIYCPPNTGGIRPVEGVKPRKKKRRVSLRGQTAEEVIGKYVEKDESPPDEECPICFEKLSNVSHYTEEEEEGGDCVLRLDRCGHLFHQSCLYAMYNSGPKDGSIQCPTCKAIYGVKCGNQPPGSMDYHVIPHSLPGFPSVGTIRIIYSIPPGTQGPEHPNPGRRYSARGFPRMCYLPDSEIGRKILRLLIVAWERRLTFTIGTSVTTGEPNTVVWNEIHHKTEFGSNVTGHGFPDPNYFSNILGELASQGVTEECLDD